jgi:hypothetical protein
MVIGCWNYSVGDSQGLLSKNCRLRGVFVHEQFGPRENGQKRDGNIIERMRMEAHVSFRLGGPILDSSKSLTRRCGSVQARPREPEDAPQIERASRMSGYARVARKGFAVSRIERIQSQQLRQGCGGPLSSIIVFVHLLDAKNLILPPPHQFAKT